MKKKMKGETKTLPSVTLYKPDLEEIIEAFRGNCADLQITDDEFEYDSIEELEGKRGQKITKLTIASTAPELSLMIGKDGNTFLTRGGSIQSIVPFAQIEEILNRTKRPVMAVLLNFAFCFPLFVIEIFLLIRFQYSQFKAWLIVLIMVTTVPQSVATMAQRRGAFSKILLINPHDEKSFWVRNKDTVLVGVIVAVITAFVTWLITYLTST